jgi:hypothetical protein
MTASTPLQIDGKTYDRYALQLAITGGYKSDGSQDASIAMLLIPTRLENQVVETADSAAIGFLRGHLSEIADPAEQVAVSAIQHALQTYITAKGL